MDTYSTLLERLPGDFEKHYYKGHLKFPTTDGHLILLCISAVIVPLAVYRIIWRYFESVVIDGMNPALQFSMTYFSRVVRGHKQE